MPEIRSPQFEIRISPLPLSSVFRLWLPLALSFELMMLEGPGIQAAIGRLPEPALNLAAWGLTMSLSLLVESPVIMLLSTATALVRDESSYRALRRFMLALIIACTVVTGLVAFTPLFGLVSGSVMGQPPEIVRAARPAMMIMLFWTAAIGWRRFYQGILVGQGRTRPVTYGTAFRLCAAIGVAWYLARDGGLPGVQVGAIALMAAVVTEAIATTLFALPTLNGDLRSAPRAVSELTQGDIWRFHAPLALTTVLMLLAQPLTAAALARLPNPVDSLAAWPVVAMVLLVMRGWCFALQEITISLARNPADLPHTRRAAAIIGVVTTAATLLFAFTPLLTAYLGRSGINVPLSLWDDVKLGIAVGGLLPLITALACQVRGMLVAGKATREVYRGMAIGLATHTALLVVGVALQIPPMWAASGAFTLGAVAEYLYLTARATALSLPAMDAIEDYA